MTDDGRWGPWRWSLGCDCRIGDPREYTMRSSSLCLIAIAFTSVTACAQGMDSEGDNTGDDTTPSPDANDDDPPIDARPPIDASTPIDANVPIDASVPIDAPT